MEELGNSKLSLRDYFHVIFKRKKQILLFFLITIIAVAVVTFVVKPTYEAKLQILVKLGRESVYIPQSERANPIISVNSENQINSEIEVLNNRSLIEKVMNTLAPTPIYENLSNTDAILNFQKSLSITRIKNSNIIEISFKHKDPKLAATVVNTLANAYLEEHLKIHRNPKSVGFFEEQSKNLKSKLEQAKERLKSFKEQYNVTDLKEEQRILLKQISDLRAELDRTLSQEIETKNQIRPLRPHEEKLVELEIKEKDLLTKYTPNSRLVRNVQEEIDMAKEKILLRDQAERKSLYAKKMAQNSRLAYYQNKLEKLNQLKVKLDQLQMAVDVDHQNYLLYQAKFEESRISDAMDDKKISSVSVIEPALQPLKPVFPKVSLNIFLGLVLGVFGGLVLAFFAEYLDDRLEKPSDVEQVLQLPVLASIPELKMKG